MITDLKWFSDVMELLAQGNTKSNDLEAIRSVIGADIPMWEINQLKQSLNKTCPAGMVNLHLYMLVLEETYGKTFRFYNFKLFLNNRFSTKYSLE